MEKRIVIVEDNPADLNLTKLAFGELDISDQLIHFDNGGFFIEYLAVVSAKDVSFVLLDLNLPGLTGFEILKYLRETPEYKDMPVIVFTTSIDLGHMHKCYKLGCNAYVAKPLDINDYFNTIQRISGFWMRGATIKQL